MQITKISKNYSKETFGMPFVNKNNPELLKSIKKLSPQKQQVCLYTIDYIDRNSPYHKVVYQHDTFPFILASKNTCQADNSIRNLEAKQGIIIDNNVCKLLNRILRKIEEENFRIKKAKEIEKHLM